MPSSWPNKFLRAKLYVYSGCHKYIPFGPEVFRYRQMQNIASGLRYGTHYLNKPVDPVTYDSGAVNDTAVCRTC